MAGALFCDPKLTVKRCIDAFYSTCVPAALHGAGEWAYTQSMFQALRIWELGKLRRVLCLRRRPNECLVDCMKRTVVIVARQLKKHNQPRVQTLAMRRVRIAARQMVSWMPRGRYWEESATWRCDELWRDEYIKLSKEDYRNSTQWKRLLPGRPNYWERPFTRFLGDAWIPNKRPKQSKPNQTKANQQNQQNRQSNQKKQQQQTKKRTNKQNQQQTNQTKPKHSSVFDSQM